MKIFTLSIALCLLVKLNGQSLNIDGGGGAYNANAGMVSLGVDRTHLYHNASNDLYTPSKWKVDASYDQRFGFTALTTIGIAGMYKLSRLSSAGLSFVRFGEIGLFEQRIALNYGRRLSEHVCISGQVNGHNINLSDYGKSSWATIDLGVTSSVSKTVSMGVLVSNIGAMGRNNSLQSPTRLVIGFGYRPSDKVTIAAEVEKILDRKLTVKTAVQYRILPVLRLGVGADLVRGAFGVGLTYSFSGISATGAYNAHERLGQYPSFSIGYSSPEAESIKN